MKEKKQNLHGKGKGRVLNFTKKNSGIYRKRRNATGGCFTQQVRSDIVTPQAHSTSTCSTCFLLFAFICKALFDPSFSNSQYFYEFIHLVYLNANKIILACHLSHQEKESDSALAEIMHHLAESDKITQTNDGHG